VLNVYRAPSGSIDTFVDELSVVIDELLDSGCHLLLMGDFNCPGTTSTCVDDRLTMLLSEYGLRPVNSQPTRYNPQMGTKNLLDLLIESEDDDSALHSVSTRSVMFSDHSAVIGKLRLKRPPEPVVSFRHRDLKNVDINALRLHLVRSSLITAQSDDPDECMDSFLGDIVAALDKEAPMWNFCRRRSHVANQWLSSEATEAKRESRRLERKFIRLRSTASYDVSKAAHTTANELMMQSRGKFIANEVADVSSNPRLLWRTVNRLLHPGNACCSYGGHHNADVAASFSQFCRNKLQCVKDSISSTLSSWPFALVADPLPCVNDRTLAELSTVTDDEVEAAIKNCRTSHHLLTYCQYRCSSYAYRRSSP